MEQWTPEPEPVGAQQPQAGTSERHLPHYGQTAPAAATVDYQQPYQVPQQAYPQQPYGQPYPQQQAYPGQQFAPPQQPPVQQPSYPYPAPQQPYPQQYAQPYPPQPQPQPYPQPQYAPPPQQPSVLPPDQSGGAPVSFPPPANPPQVRDVFRNGAAPYLQPGEQVYYGFMLKLDSTIEETPRELKIAIEGQHHVLGDIHRASTKVNRGMRWAANPLDALTEKMADKASDAMFRHLAGPVFVGGWLSQAGWFVRYVRATEEDYGPGAYGAVTNQRYLVFRASRVGGSEMRLVYAVPRTFIAGVRLEGGKDAVRRGRTPRAELHFTDGSMVATMMPGKQGEQLAAVIQTQLYG